MNKNIVIAVAVVVILLGGGWLFLSRKSAMAPTQETMPQSSEMMSASSEPAMMQESNAIDIKNFAYSPAAVTVKAGATVTITNNDSVAHSVSADDSSFDTGLIQPGKSATLTFSKAGTFSYHCSVHPNMKGTITVQ